MIPSHEQAVGHKLTGFQGKLCIAVLIFTTIWIVCALCGKKLKCCSSHDSSVFVKRCSADHCSDSSCYRSNDNLGLQTNTHIGISWQNIRNECNSELLAVAVARWRYMQLSESTTCSAPRLQCMQTTLFVSDVTA